MSAERRQAEREQLQTLLPVSLEISTPSGTRQIPGCVFDVSADGLCLIVREDLVEGTSASLAVLGDRLAMQVAWSHKDAERAYRCGLRSVVDGRDLRGFFSSLLRMSRAEG